MNFCPACGTRAVAIDRKNEHTRYRCTKLNCAKVFKPKNE